MANDPVWKSQKVILPWIMFLKGDNIWIEDIAWIKATLR